MAQSEWWGDPSKVQPPPPPPPPGTSQSATQVVTPISAGPESLVNSVDGSSWGTVEQRRRAALETYRDEESSDLSPSLSTESGAAARRRMSKGTRQQRVTPTNARAAALEVSSPSDPLMVKVEEPTLDLNDISSEDESEGDEKKSLSPREQIRPPSQGQTAARTNPQERAPKEKKGFFGRLGRKDKKERKGRDRKEEKKLRKPDLKKMKPGQSYKSSAHSAEIVVRRPPSTSSTDKTKKGANPKSDVLSRRSTPKASEAAVAPSLQEKGEKYTVSRKKSTDSKSLRSEQSAETNGHSPPKVDEAKEEVLPSSPTTFTQSEQAPPPPPPPLPPPPLCSSSVPDPPKHAVDVPKPDSFPRPIQVETQPVESAIKEEQTPTEAEETLGFQPMFATLSTPPRFDVGSAQQWENGETFSPPQFEEDDTNVPLEDDDDGDSLMSSKSEVSEMTNPTIFNQNDKHMFRNPEAARVKNGGTPSMPKARNIAASNKNRFEQSDTWEKEREFIPRQDDFDRRKTIDGNCALNYSDPPLDNINCASLESSDDETNTEARSSTMSAASDNTPAMSSPPTLSPAMSSPPTLSPTSDVVPSSHRKAVRARARSKRDGRNEKRRVPLTSQALSPSPASATGSAPSPASASESATKPSKVMPSRSMDPPMVLRSMDPPMVMSPPPPPPPTKHAPRKESKPKRESKPKLPKRLVPDPEPSHFVPPPKPSPKPRGSDASHASGSPSERQVDFVPERTGASRQRLLPTGDDSLEESASVLTDNDSSVDGSIASAGSTVSTRAMAYKRKQKAKAFRRPKSVEDLRIEAGEFDDLQQTGSSNQEHAVRSRGVNQILTTTSPRTGATNFPPQSPVKTQGSVYHSPVRTRGITPPTPPLSPTKRRGSKAASPKVTPKRTRGIYIEQKSPLSGRRIESKKSTKATNHLTRSPMQQDSPEKSRTESPVKSVLRIQRAKEEQKVRDEEARSRYSRSTMKAQRKIAPSLRKAPADAKVKTPTASRSSPTSKPSVSSPEMHSDIADPIQRAGMRLLSKAAIPIQSQIRRHLAIRLAAKRAYSVIVIQSYFRRWLCEQEFYDFIYCAARIQAAFRGWLVRETLADEHHCATQIQRIVRGYLSSLHVYKSLYNVTIIQSAVRRSLAKHEAENRFFSILLIQAFYRGYMVRKERDLKNTSATRIQSLWRCYYSQLKYQFDVVDIIIVQSVVRRKMALDNFKKIRQERINFAAVQIQRAWRGFGAYTNFVFLMADVLIVQRQFRVWKSTRDAIALKKRLREVKVLKEKRLREEKRLKAAVAIQRTWRGFLSYSGFIFTMSDIVIVQRVAREWLAKRRVARVRAERTFTVRYDSATRIQKIWRGHVAQIDFMYALVHIILVQSIVRRRLVVRAFSERLTTYKAAQTIQACWRGYVDRMFHARRVKAAIRIQNAWRGFARFSCYLIAKFEEHAAITIQRYWRGFWQSSHYIILHFEILRVQALIRGYLERQWLSFEKECATVIQANARRYLVIKEARRKRIVDVLVLSHALGMRYKCAATRLQRWIREVMVLAREKSAALVIERFFIMLKREVDREIERRERNRQAKREKRRRQKKEADEKLLERVWLTTVDSEDADSTKLRKAKEAAAHEIRSQRERGSSHRLNGRHGPMYEESRSRAGSARSRSRLESQKSVGKSYSSGRHHGKTSLRDENRHHESKRGVQNGHITSAISYEQGRREHFAPPTTTVHESDEQSDISGLTSPSVFNKGVPSRFTSLSRKELSDDLSLEEAWIDTEIHQVKEKKRSDDGYLKRNGIQTSSSSYSSSRHRIENRRIAMPQDDSERKRSSRTLNVQERNPRSDINTSSSGSVRSRGSEHLYVTRSERSAVSSQGRSSSSHRHREHDLKPSRSSSASRTRASPKQTRSSSAIRTYR